MTEGPIILFDGVCYLCDRTVQFVLKRDPDKEFRFAALQSAAARSLLDRFGIDSQRMNSVVLIADDRAYMRSDAALRIAARLAGPCSLLKVFLPVPRPLRDWVYDVIARNRYRWFGKKDTCLMPSPDWSDRFLS